MPKLNFYDTDAVKAFVLNILVENEELRSSLDFERRQVNTWFQDAQTQKARVEAAEAKIDAAKSKLEHYQKARQDGVQTSEMDTDRTITEVLDVLKGGDQK